VNANKTVNVDFTRKTISHPSIQFGSQGEQIKKKCDTPTHFILMEVGHLISKIFMKKPANVSTFLECLNTLLLGVHLSKYIFHS
jgi:hypothetical protein